MKTIWTGRIISGLIVLFLIADSIVKFIKPEPVVTIFAHLGLAESLTGVLGAICLICTALYAIPLTAFFGAILLTGYLGGAVAIHLRVGDPLFDTIFPIILGLLAWAGLYLREARLRALVGPPHLK